MNTHPTVLKRSLEKADKFVGFHPDRGVAIAFGCKKCDWIGTPSCSHNLERGQHHSNWYCSERMRYIKELMVAAGSVPKALQVDQVAKTVMLLNSMMKDGGDEGETVHPQLHQVQRNLIKLLGDMRKQDEGIKVQGEVHHFHDDYIKVVASQAKVLNEEGRDNSAG